eukprot:8435329-Pyramimonas_sp.AAC.1
MANSEGLPGMGGLVARRLMSACPPRDRTVVAEDSVPPSCAESSGAWRRTCSAKVSSSCCPPVEASRATAV